MCLRNILRHRLVQNEFRDQLPQLRVFGAQLNWLPHLLWLEAAILLLPPANRRLGYAEDPDDLTHRCSQLVLPDRADGLIYRVPFPLHPAAASESQADNQSSHSRCLDFLGSLRWRRRIGGVEGVIASLTLKCMSVFFTPYFKFLATNLISLCSIAI